MTYLALREFIICFCEMQHVFEVKYEPQDSSYEGFQEDGMIPEAEIIRIGKSECYLR